MNYVEVIIAGAKAAISERYGRNGFWMRILKNVPVHYKISL